MTILKSTAIAMATLLLAACGGDVRDTKITPELLEKPELAAKVANRLEPADREIFGRYLMGRLVSATPLGALGKPLVNSEGKDPATVGEAIDLMKKADQLQVRRDALIAERQAKEDELRKKREGLSAIAEASGWRAKETDASNAVIDEIEALRKEYQAKIEAIQ